jgi:drug/metabolite transporter (DMT)-like permease
MTERSVIKVLLLSIFTCGIYFIYWEYVTAQELNNKEPEEPLMNYILAILLGIVTCGIYGIYWSFKFYKKVDNVTGENNLIVNFILSLLGLNLVSTCIVQNSINNM